MRLLRRMVVLRGGIWTPAALGLLLALWLDANDSSTITLNGSTVSQWRDKSGNARHVSQATTANQPTYRETSLMGKPTLDWGAGNNSRFLSCTGMTGYSPVRFFGVAEYDGPSPFIEYYGLFSHNIVSYRDLLITNNFGFSWFIGDNSGNCFLNGSDSPSSLALPTISSPFIFATDFAQAANRSDLIIGRDRIYPGREWRGKISEIIALNALPSTTDRQRIEGYLAHKWELTANLPSDHPFRFSPPLLS